MPVSPNISASLQLRRWRRSDHDAINTDWIDASGSWNAGRGGHRPVNPRLLATLRAKEAPPKAKPNSSSRAYRRLVVSVAQASLRELPNAGGSIPAQARQPCRHDSARTMAPGKRPRRKNADTSCDASLAWAALNRERSTSLQGGRANTGRQTYNLNGKLATRMHSPSQPQPVVVRPQPATPQGAPRSGSREIASVGSAGMVEAGKVTGSPPQPVQKHIPPTA